MAARKTHTVKINRRTTRGLSSGVLLEEIVIGGLDLLILTRMITKHMFSIKAKFVVGNSKELTQ